jgi:N-acetyl sugar amidotransferase
MKYCSRCLYPENHPYGLIFDEAGVCSGCRIHEEKDTLNWDLRFEKLKKIVFENSKRISKRGFDCIIPVTGGGDSYFIVHTVKNILGMNPLLVNYNSHYNTKIGIRNLANLATVFDCDILQSTLSPALIKKITRTTIKEFGSIYWHVLAGSLTFPVQVAVKFKIPLIIWGVHPWSDQNGMFSHLDEVEMTERCRKEHPLMGISAEDLLKSNTITRRDIQPFVYPYDNEIEAVGVRGIYLSNYLRWDSKAQHEKMISLYGYETAKQQRTFNNYEDVHCFHSAGLHDYLKFIKLGYSKVTDHASREIRLRRMKREEGLKMVKKYSNVVPSDMKLFLDWIEMDENEFMNYFWNKRDLRAWTKSDSGVWNLKDSIENHADDKNIELSRLNLTEKKCTFLLTKSSEPLAKENNYLLMGRSYIDKYNFGAIDDQPKKGGPTKRKWTKPKI